MEDSEQSSTRRDFLKKAGKVIAGAGAAVTVGFGSEHAESADKQLTKQVVVPGLAVGESPVSFEPPNNDEEKGKFSWTQEEVLMGPGAGFESGRNGEPIKVWFDPKVKSLVDTSSFDAWNDLARKMGRNKDLFAYVDEASGSQIYVLPSPDGTTFIDPFDSRYGQYKTNPEGPFSWVNIQCATDGESPINNVTLLHEIGHALGFVDFVTEFMYENPESLKKYINPQPGFLEEKPINSVLNYAGEYIDRGQLGPDDGSLLRIGGYII